MWDIGGIGRARVGVVLWTLLLLGCLGLATEDWRHRDDPTVWGQFVRTSPECSGRGCVTTGDWRPYGSDQVVHDVALDGDVGENGRVRAVWRGPWPVPEGQHVGVRTQRATELDPWLAVGVTGGAAVALAVDLRIVRRHRAERSRRAVQPSSERAPSQPVTDSDTHGDR